MEMLHLWCIALLWNVSTAHFQREVNTLNFILKSNEQIIDWLTAGVQDVFDLLASRKSARAGPRRLVTMATGLGMRTARRTIGRRVWLITSIWFCSLHLSRA